MQLMKSIHAAELGGTLFVPASHKHLETIARGEKFPRLRSVVFDTEDGLDEAALDEALQRLRALLPTFGPTPLFRFIRPRNADVLQQLLSMEGIEKIDGFVLPKFGLQNAHEYLSLMQQHDGFSFMPSIEGEELFNAASLHTLKKMLLPYNNRIIVIRFGAEDMLRQLGMRRDCDTSLYDLCATSQVIGTLLGVFKPAGFSVSAPVYRCFKDHEGFEKEVLRDLKEGLISKTIIHPDQIEGVERLYRVSETELDEARQIIDSEHAVLNISDTMAEKSTQVPWAKIIIRRSELYGVPDLTEFTSI